LGWASRIAAGCAAGCSAHEVITRVAVGNGFLVVGATRLRRLKKIFFREGFQRFFGSSQSRRRISLVIGAGGLGGIGSGGLVLVLGVLVPAYFLFVDGSGSCRAL
jgi:hypothetical protein